MLFGAQRYPVHAQRLVALDEISRWLVFAVPTRVGQQLGGQNAQPVEFTDSTQIRRCDEGTLSTTLYELERAHSHRARQRRIGAGLTALNIQSAKPPLLCARA